MEEQDIIAKLKKIGKGDYVGQEDRETLKLAIKQRKGKTDNRYGLKDDKQEDDRRRVPEQSNRVGDKTRSSSNRDV